LLFIVVANLPEFGLWTFLSTAERDLMSTASVDHVTRFVHYFLVDGKGYGIFSVLFGLGFALFYANAERKGRNGASLFARRMFWLLLFGLLHLLFLWSGDILCLYALTGLLLLLFRRCSNRVLVGWAVALLALPVVVEFAQQLTDTDLAHPLEEAWWNTAHGVGITEYNFATWLRDADNYALVLKFLQQGAVERMWEFVDGNRLPKVLGFFLLGYCIGRNEVYKHLDEWKPRLLTFCFCTALAGIPLSLLYAYDCMSGGLWGAVCSSAIYALSVPTMTLFYIVAFALLWHRRPGALVFAAFAALGRMAFTNYIGQSVLGIAIYYGIGLGLGLSMGHAQIALVAFGIYLFQILFSLCWLHFFAFGPLEWLWRMLTYGRFFPIARRS